MSRDSVNVWDRFLAVLLMLGGILGIGLSVYMGMRMLRIHWVYGVLVAAFLLVFVWSGLSGLRLWRGERRGWKWATILFALQIPILTLPGLSYEYYTGIAIPVMGGHVDKWLTFSVGAEANFYLDTRITDWVYGVNVFALAATVYLLTRRRSYVAADAAQPPAPATP